MSELSIDSELNRRLEDVLDRIHPSRLQDEFARVAERAVRQVMPRETLIRDIDRFESIVARLLYAMESGLLPAGRVIEYDDHHCRGAGRGLLLRCYAREQNGSWMAAFEYARTGNRGGIAGVCKVLADRWVHDRVADVARALVNGFYFRLSHAERDRVVDLYLAHYGHLLPPEITEGGATRMRGVAFTRVLEAHPRLYERTR